MTPHYIAQQCKAIARGKLAFNGRTGPKAVRDFVMASCGYSVDANGQPRISSTIESGPAQGKPALKTSAFAGLGYALLGDDFTAREKFRWARENKGAMIALEAKAALGELTIEDAGAGGVGPGVFADISAWNVAVTGLLEVRILERFNSPEFVGLQMVQRIPTRIRSGKHIGVGRMGDQAKRMEPLDHHPRASLQQRWINTPTTNKTGLACLVSREAAYFDLTGQVTAEADRVGDELGLAREFEILKVVLGITNNYSYKGTNYNTYLTSGNWINTVASAPLVDWTDIDDALNLASKMTDQESGQRISVNWDTLWCTPRKAATARNILMATEIETRTSSSTEIRRGTNPYTGTMFRVIVSPLFHQLLVESGVSDTNAEQYWGLLDTQRAFGWWENWDITTTRASANDFIMADQDIAEGVFANFMGAAGVLEPRYAFLAKDQ